MAEKVKVWFDAEADYLEVRFSDAAGYQKEQATMQSWNALIRREILSASASLA